LDRTGNVYIADAGNNRIRKISNGIITTVAGNGKFAASSADGGPAADAQLFWPIDMAMDGAGNTFGAGFAQRSSPK
jgi:DNA-binding beta-propeller fold protein YncE